MGISRATAERGLAILQRIADTGVADIEEVRAFVGAGLAKQSRGRCAFQMCAEPVKPCGKGMCGWESE